MLSLLAATSVGATLLPSPACAQSLALLGSRSLLQTEPETQLFVADFKSLLKANLQTANITLNETALLGSLPVAPGTQEAAWQPLPFGTYDLTPKMVGEIVGKVSDQLVRSKLDAACLTQCRSQLPIPRFSAAAHAQTGTQVYMFTFVSSKLRVILRSEGIVRATFQRVLSQCLPSRPCSKSVSHCRDNCPAGANCSSAIVCSHVIRLLVQRKGSELQCEVVEVLLLSLLSHHTSPTIVKRLRDRSSC
jgi:hypothetical protein